VVIYMAGWALSKIIGDGSFKILVGFESTTGPYRAEASNYGSHIALIASASDGTPLINWCLVKLGNDFDTVSAESNDNLRVFPNLTLGHILTAGQAATLNSYADHFGITGGRASAGMTVRQVLRWLADKLDTTWDIDIQYLSA
jgi:hypothetical protein